MIEVSSYQQRRQTKKIEKKKSCKQTKRWEQWKRCGTNATSRKTSIKVIHFSAYWRDFALIKQKSFFYRRVFASQWAIDKLKHKEKRINRYCVTLDEIGLFFPFLFLFLSNPIKWKNEQREASDKYFVSFVSFFSVNFQLKFNDRYRIETHPVEHRCHRWRGLLLNLNDQRTSSSL